MRAIQQLFCSCFTYLSVHRPNPKSYQQKREAFRWWISQQQLAMFLARLRMRFKNKYSSEVQRRRHTWREYCWMSTDASWVRWIRSRESGESETKNRVLSDSLYAFQSLRDFQFWRHGMHLCFLLFAPKLATCISLGILSLHNRQATFGCFDIEQAISIVHYWGVSSINIKVVGPTIKVMDDRSRRSWEGAYSSKINLIIDYLGPRIAVLLRHSSYKVWFELVETREIPCPVISESSASLRDSPHTCKLGEDICDKCPMSFLYWEGISVLSKNLH